MGGGGGGGPLDRIGAGGTGRPEPDCHPKGSWVAGAVGHPVWVTRDTWSIPALATIGDDGATNGAGGGASSADRSLSPSSPLKPAA